MHNDTSIFASDKLGILFTENNLPPREGKIDIPPQLETEEGIILKPGNEYQYRLPLMVERITSLLGNLTTLKI